MIESRSGRSVGCWHIQFCARSMESRVSFAVCNREKFPCIDGEDGEDSDNDESPNYGTWRAHILHNNNKMYEKREIRVAVNKLAFGREWQRRMLANVREWEGEKNVRRERCVCSARHAHDSHNHRMPRSCRAHQICILSVRVQTSILFFFLLSSLCSTNLESLGMQSEWLREWLTR